METEEQEGLKNIDPEIQQLLDQPSVEGSAAPKETPAEQPAGPDFDALQERILGLGIDGVTLENIPDRLKETHTTLRNLQNTNAELSKKAEMAGDFEPLVKLLQEKPHLNDSVYELLQQKLQEEQSYGQDNIGIQQELAQAFDPVLSKVHHLETKIAKQELQEKLSNLETEFGKDFVTKEVKDAVVQTCLETKNFDDAESVFYKLYGKQLLARATKTGRKEAVDAITGQNQSTKGIIPESGFSSQPAPPDRSQMNAAEEEAYNLELVQGYLNSPSKARKDIEHLGQ